MGFSYTIYVLQESFSSSREKSSIDKNALLDLSGTLKEQVGDMFFVIFYPLFRDYLSSFITFRLEDLSYFSVPYLHFSRKHLHTNYINLHASSLH